MALGSRIGSLYVRVGADTRQFHREMRRVNSPLERFRTVAGTAIKSFAAIGAAATAASVGIYALARSEMNLIDEQAKLARSIGGTVTGLRTLKLAAEDNGIDGLEGSLNRLNRRLGAVEMGGGPAAETIKRLGLNIKELSEMDIDDRLAAIADTIHESGMSAQEAARHLQQLGFQQQEATTFFMQGGDAIRAARGEIEDYGLAVSMLDAARMEEANTQMSRMSLVVQGLRTQLAVALAPTLLEIAQRFASVARAVMSTITRVNEVDGAAEGLRSNTAIVQFARRATIALARLADGAVTAVRGINLALRSLELIQAWGQMEAARRRLESSEPTWLDKLLGRPTELAERQKALEDAAKAHTAASEAVIAARKRLAREGEKSWEDIVREAWDVDPPEVRLPDGRNNGSGATDSDDEATSRAIAQQAEKHAQLLRGLQSYLGETRKLEAERAVEMIDALEELHSAQAIANDEYYAMTLGVVEKFYENLSELEQQQLDERREKLREMNELGLVDAQEYRERDFELMQEHEERLAELMENSFRHRMELLEEMREEAEITDEEYRERVREAEQQLQDDLTLIAARGAHARNRVSSDEAAERSAAMRGMMGNLTQLMNSGNKEMFRIGKIAAIAQAVLAGREAVVSSYKVGARIGGPALGAAFAAAAGAATAAQIASVKNTSFGGGGGSASIGGGAVYTRPTDAISDPPVAAEAPKQHTVATINLVGEVFNRQQVRELIEHINEATKDGAVLRLN